jgi:hypothetical protein
VSQGPLDVNTGRTTVPEAVFVLGPHRSFTSVLTTCLGQHPQLYGLPETNLFMSETMWDWWRRQDAGRALGAHGLLRAVAETVYGEQSARTVPLALRWIRHRLTRTPPELMGEIGMAVRPRRLVEKSPMTSARPERLRGLRAAFPRAAFVHVVRAPVNQAQSMLVFLAEFGVPRQRIARWLAAGGDPYDWWYLHNTNIRSFLDTVPARRRLRMRGEDVLQDPARGLAAIADHLGLDADAAAIEPMLHPERSPFARFGPPGAELGNDVHFLRNPRLRTPSTTAPASIAAPTLGPPPEKVVRLAVELGCPLAT